LLPVSIPVSGYYIVGVLGAYIGLEGLACTAKITYYFVVGGIFLLLLALIPQ